MNATYLEPILLDLDVSTEEYDLELDALEELDVEIDTVIQVKQIEADEYDGSYTVTPTFENQYLETTNKLLRDDVTVYSIPVSRTANPAGGTTVYIGG